MMISELQAFETDVNCLQLFHYRAIEFIFVSLTILYMILIKWC